MSAAIVDKRKRRRILNACLLVIATCCFSLWRTQCTHRPKPDYRSITAAGQLVAEETLKLIGSKGEVVVVSIESDSANLQLNAFRTALTKRAGVTLVAVEKMDKSKLTVGPMGAGLSAQEFFDLLKKYQKVSAIVSLLGPPLLKEQEIQSVPQGIPRIVVFAGMGFGVKKLLEEEVISIAIVPRIPGGAMTTAGPPGSSQPSSPYEVLTPQNIRSRAIFEPPMPPQPGQKK